MKKYAKFLCVLLGSAFLLAGCATSTIPLTSGAENVRVIDATTYPGNLPLSNCQLKGEIHSRFVTPYEQKELTPSDNEIRLLKNKAVVLGANLVVINHNMIFIEGRNYDHAMVSDAYDCL